MRRTISKLIIVVTSAVIAVPFAVNGQDSSLNTFSPYSFYGFGDISLQGSTAIRSMGGAGVAVRDPRIINYLNPASYSATGPKSALLTANLEGQNFFLKDANTQSSFNTFNIRDLAFQIPLGQGMGFALSVTPYSSVGYRIGEIETTGVVASEIGYLTRSFEGSGNINQIKAGIGYDIVPGLLSIGMEGVYYRGRIVRNYNTIFYPITSIGTYTNFYGSDTEIVSSFSANFGMQVAPVNKNGKLLSVGAVYRMGGRMSGRTTELVPYYPAGLSGLGIDDTVRYHSSALAINMPHVIVTGVSYTGSNYSLAADYSYSSWGSSNTKYQNNRMGFRDTHSVMAGIEIVPNPGDVRSYFKRCAYRFGMRYSDYYMVINGQNIGEKAISLGIGLPLDSRRLNTIDLGIEVGTRGTASFGLVRENYFKFSIGFNLFGNDHWFKKYIYD